MFERTASLCLWIVNSILCKVNQLERIGFKFKYTSYLKCKILTIVFPLNRVHIFSSFYQAFLCAYILEIENKSMQKFSNKIRWMHNICFMVLLHQYVFIYCCSYELLFYLWSEKKKIADITLFDIINALFLFILQRNNSQLFWNTRSNVSSQIECDLRYTLFSLEFTHTYA